MVRKKLCVVCGSKENLYSFPKNEALRKQWIEAFNLDPSKLQSYDRVCQAHFLFPADFRGKNPKFLKNKAIPSLNKTQCETENLIGFTSNTTGDENKINICRICRKVSANSFHSFPKNPYLREKWATFCQTSLENVKNHHVLCCRHFSEDNFEISTNRRLLKKDAVPTILPPTSFESDKENYMNFNSARTKMNDSVKNIPLEEDSMEMTMQLEESNSIEPLDLSLPLRSRDLNSTLSTESRKRTYFRYFGDIKEDDVLTPRRAKLILHKAEDIIDNYRKKLAAVRAENFKLKIEMSQLLTELESYNLLSQHAVQNILSALPITLREIIERILKTLMRQGELEIGDIQLTPTEQGNKYPPELRQFAITVHFYSARAYEYLREKWNYVLPAPSTLKAWFRVVDGRPGFTQESFQTLQNMTSQLDKTVVCNLCIDEISIKQSLEFINNRSYGYVNVGVLNSDVDGQQLASHILTFLVVGLNGNWKLPIAYFPIHSLNGQERGNLLKIALELLHDVGIKVRSITFDGLNVNRTMCTALGANFEYNSANFQPWIFHPITNERVYIFLDPCHMLKLVRNTIGEKGPLRISNQPNAVIDWEHIVNLHETQQNEGLHSGNKITKRHVNFKEAKMNVRIAAQTMSSSVASSLRFLKRIDSSFQNADYMATFCDTFNDAFDILNCRNVYSKSKFNKPLNDFNWDFLKKRADEIIRYIENLQDSKGTPILKTERFVGFLGFIICLQNIFRLFEDIKKDGMTFLLTYKLLQDFIENFFSAVRSRGGFNDNPTCRQFETSYKRLLIHAEIKLSGKSNCGWNGIAILHCGDLKNKSDSLLDDSNCTSDMFYENFADDHDYLAPTWISSDYVAYVTYFIGGYIVRQLKNRISCQICKAAIEDPNGENDQASLLIRMKTRGGLIYPSKDVHYICLQAENIFRQNLNRMDEPKFTAILTNTIMRKIMNDDVFQSSALKNHFFSQEVLHNHLYQLMKLIVECYVRIRMKYEARVRSQPKSFDRRVLHKQIHFRESRQIVRTQSREI